MKLYPKILFSMPINSIVWMEGDGNYTRVHLKNGTYQTLSYTLKFFADKLPDFVRIHKSSLVNPLYVHKLTSKGYKDYWLTLTSGHTLSVSRKRMSQTASKLNLPAP